MSASFDTLIADSVVTGAAILYSLLLLVASYWLATAPSPAALQRTVEWHASFQYLWALTLADFLIDKGVVTPQVNVASHPFQASNLSISALKVMHFVYPALKYICHSNPFRNQFRQIRLK